MFIPHLIPAIAAPFPTIWIEEVKLDLDVDSIGMHKGHRTTSPSLPMVDRVSNLMHASPYSKCIDSFIMKALRHCSHRCTANLEANCSCPEGISLWSQLSFEIMVTDALLFVFWFIQVGGTRVVSGVPRPRLKPACI